MVSVWYIITVALFYKCNYSCHLILNEQCLNSNIFTCYILQKKQRNFPLTTQLYEVCSLKGWFRKQNSIVSNDSYRIAMNSSKTFATKKKHKTIRKLTSSYLSRIFHTCPWTSCLLILGMVLLILNCEFKLKISRAPCSQFQLLSK